MANVNHTMKVKTAAGYDVLFPKTTAEQVITDASNRFVSDIEKAAWNAKPGSNAVTSVAGKTGAVTLTASDVGLGSLSNTADSAKNVLSATKLTTPRTINGVSFDGTANITVADSTKLPLSGGTISGNLTVSGVLKGNTVEGAVYNDYAETRRAYTPVSAGRCVVEALDGKVCVSRSRLNKGAMLTTDTYGMLIGEKQGVVVPIAVAGRVLAHVDSRKRLRVGDAVCSGIGGTVSRMKWWEIILFPDRIVGTVSEFPQYETWGENSVHVNVRIWIRVR